MSKKIIIMGSSASMGNTYNVCKKIIKATDVKFQDLNELVIMPYDYDHDNRDDDYLGFIKHVVQSYDTIILATPVYWYSVSGLMKNFIDRFTDLLTIEKDTGRALRGKDMMLLSVSKEDDCPEAFASPLVSTAEYLGMQFLGHTHVPVQKEELAENRISEVINKLK